MKNSPKGGGQSHIKQRDSFHNAAMSMIAGENIPLRKNAVTNSAASMPELYDPITHGFASPTGKRSERGNLPSE